MAPGSEVQVAEALGQRTHPATGLIQGALWAVAGVAAMASSIGSRDVIWSALAVPLGLVLGMAVGFLQWSFTRYVIDGTELRITSGVLSKNSRRIPYERLQSVDITEPLVARVFGLAELRIEMAGGDKSRTSLKFLRLSDAHELRSLLLLRAHGEDPQSLDALDPTATVLAAVPSERIAIGTLLSLDFLFAVVGAVALVVIGVWFDRFLAILGGLIPTAFWLVQIVSKRVVAQWGFTLTRTSRGLRIERGLLSRTSQTVPFDRVQGIAVEEPFVWRFFGWMRLEVDVAGYAASDDEGGESISTLLPISDPQLALQVIDELIPGNAFNTEPLAYAPRRSAWFAPVGWRYRALAVNDASLLTRSGWIQHTRNIVPHQKTQSVAISQGPLQRMLGLATLDVHTPKGPVDAEARNYDAAVVRREAFAQLDRAHAARQRTP